jgi:hypothetical protein
MTWNLRLVNMSDPDETYIEIREVYYDQMGKPLGHCAAHIGGENVGELRTYIEWAIEALDKPILTFGDNDDDIHD